MRKFNNVIELSNIKKPNKGSFSFLEKCNSVDNSCNNNLTFEENFKTPVKINTSHVKDRQSSGVNYKSAGAKSSSSNTAIYTVYDLDFIKNMLESEAEYNPNPDYLEMQSNLKTDYRAVLVDWLMELCEEFAFKRDTFHYTVNYIDRYLSYRPNIEKRKLQLIGVVALSIASKFEVYNKPFISN
jgi:hypothetical protein